MIFSFPNLGLRIKNSEKYKKYYSEHIEKDKSRFSYYPQEKKISLVNHPFTSSSEYFESIHKRKDNITEDIFWIGGCENDNNRFE